MRSGLLHGREHTKLGAIAALAEGSCAIALSRGGFAKGYAHRDPNEDSAAYAFGPDGALLAVADGHGGHEAAAQALDTLLSRFAEAWTDAAPLGPTWPARAGEALEQLHGEIVATGTRGGNPEARTTLALALARPGEDLLLFASVGDSHVFVARAAEAVDLAQRRDARPAYLGSPSLAPAELVAMALIGSVPLSGTRALALATDGLSEQGIGVAAPRTAVLEVLARVARTGPDLQPLEVARGLVECALAAHRVQRSGDNVATAVLRVAG
jgi:serine/threonine protein phosphatase PrpC